VIKITQSKIAGLTPRWAPFPGFSFLFDSPLATFLAGEGIETLACDLERDAELEFYRRAEAGFRALDLDRLLNEFGVCALPPASYHVTAFDVVNVGDRSRITPEALPELDTTLARLPSKEAFRQDLLTLARGSDIGQGEWNLAFRYEDLCHWGMGISIGLAPLDDSEFARFVEARTNLSRTYRALYGIGASEKFSPHVSLAYFMNPEGAEMARSQMADWDAVVRAAVGDQTIVFQSASLYGFTDMATFFRLAP